MNGKKVLVDTSVWINYFRNSSPAFSSQMDQLLSANEIYVPKIVISELIQGSKSEREVKVVNDFFDAFHIMGEKEDTWERAGKLSFNLKKKGRKVNLADCYIAVLADQYECQIFTLDEHFKDIQTALGIQLIQTEQ